MLKFSFLVFAALLGAATPAVTTQKCGESPDNLFQCFEYPNAPIREAGKKCSASLPDCESVKCPLRELGWLNADDKINKENVAAYFNQFAKDRPEWSTAVQHLKSGCLDKDVPVQGTLENCPEFDLMHCINRRIVRYAAPSQWKNTKECESSRTYAAACPFCPSDCYAPQVPAGTCGCLAPLDL